MVGRFLGSGYVMLGREELSPKFSQSVLGEQASEASKQPEWQYLERPRHTKNFSLMPPIAKSDLIV
jgi:hypothetical protein